LIDVIKFSCDLCETPKRLVDIPLFKIGGQAAKGERAIDNIRRNSTLLADVKLAISP
jgi:hypothetical protein